MINKSFEKKCFYTFKHSLEEEGNESNKTLVLKVYNFFIIAS